VGGLITTDALIKDAQYGGGSSRKSVWRERLRRRRRLKESNGEGEGTFGLRLEGGLQQGGKRERGNRLLVGGTGGRDARWEATNLPG